MGQIVRRKRRGRPSNTDRARINYSAAPPSPVDRRSTRRRRNVRYNFDIDDYVDDDEFFSDEDEEVGRREKKLRLLLSEDDSRPNTRRVRHAPTSSSSSDDYDEDDDVNDGVKHLKKRKINAGDGEDDEDNEIEEIRRRRFEEEDDEEEEHEQLEQDDDQDEEEAAALGVSASYLSKAVVPLPDKKTLELILDKLQKKDTYGVYSEPVDPDELPDYHDVIKHPMDFSTIRKKLAKGSYQTLKEFESDVYLICTNAMQYNAPDTIYHKQASSIQEQAKLRFQRLKAANVDRPEIEQQQQQQQFNTDNKIPPSFSFSPPKKQLKKPTGRPVHDPIGSETLSGSNGGANVRMEEFQNCSSAQTPVRLNSSEVIIAENCSLLDTSLDNKDKDQELVTGKGLVSKVGMKSVHDENRRATYDTCVEPVAESDSIFSIFEGESKQFIPVGLHVDHSYARSLARFAATLGSVAWKVASQTIEQSLPAGIKYGRGWVGEYEPLPTTVTIMPGDYSLKEASRRININNSTKPNNLKQDSSMSSSPREPYKDTKPSFLKFSSSNSFVGPPHVETITRKPESIPSPRPSTPVSRNGNFSSFKDSRNDGFAPGRPSQGNPMPVSREQEPGLSDPVRTTMHPNIRNDEITPGINDGFAPGRTGSREQPNDPVRMMPSFNHPNIRNDEITPGRSVSREQQPGINDLRMPSFKQVNPNDGFAPGRTSSREQPNDPVRMMSSFKQASSQNDGFAPGRTSNGNPAQVSWEQQQQQAGVNANLVSLPSFKHQNDGFAPGRPSNGNQAQAMMVPSFKHQNDGYTPGRPSNGNAAQAMMVPSFKHQNDGYSPGRPNQGNPGQISEAGLSDPVQMMKMMAERSQTQSQSQSQQNNPKRDESGAQAWMSLGGGTHKQQPQIPPGFQHQVTRFRGEVPHFQGDKNNNINYQQQQPVQAFVQQGGSHVQNNRHVGFGFPQLVTADLSRFQQQPSWRGVTPQMQMQRPKQQESCPPDLNIGYHQSSPVRQSTGMMVDSQQPDLALQL